VPSQAVLFGLPGQCCLLRLPNLSHANSGVGGVRSIGMLAQEIVNRLRLLALFELAPNLAAICNRIRRRSAADQARHRHVCVRSGRIRLSTRETSLKFAAVIVLRYLRSRDPAGLQAAMLRWHRFPPPRLPSITDLLPPSAPAISSTAEPD